MEGQASGQYVPPAPDTETKAGQSWTDSTEALTSSEHKIDTILLFSKLA